MTRKKKPKPKQITEAEADATDQKIDTWKEHKHHTRIIYYDPYNHKRKEGGEKS